MKQFGALIAMTLAATLLLFAGCSSGKNSPATGGQQMTSASLTITWPARGRLIPLAAESIKVSVAGPNEFTSSQSVNRPETGNSSTVNFINVPVGELTFTATAYPQANAQGVAQATAAVTQTGQYNMPLNVSLTMASTITAVTLTPTTPNVTVGGTTQLSATAKNAAAQVVLVPTTNAFTWSSADTSKATVDGNGLVTGKAAGTVTITATEKESGKSGTITVEVTAEAIAAYTVQELSDLKYTLDINDAGEVFGQIAISSHYGIWRPNSGVQDVSADITSAFRIALHFNNAGQVVGIYKNNMNQTHAFIWSPRYGVRDLGSLPGSSTSYAYCINDAGQVAGFSPITNTSPMVDRPFLWSFDNGMQRIDPLPPGYLHCHPENINASGQIVGRIYKNQEVGIILDQAFLWTPGSGMQSLGILSGFERSRATNINDHGAVIGYCSIAETTENEQRHYFLWTPENGMQDLSVDLWAFEADDINNAGQIVGSVNVNGHEYGCVWAPGKGMQYLPDLPGTVTSAAMAINNNGQIVGYSINPQGKYLAALWTPTQAPD